MLNISPHTRRKSDTSSESPLIVQDMYTSHIGRSLFVLKRLIKFSVVGLLSMGVITLTAFEGVHMWVEKVELSPDEDQDVRRWEWDREAEHWSGGNRGGTDPALGFKGRHAVRSAWIAQNWGTGSEVDVVTSEAQHGRTPARAASLDAVDSRSKYAEGFLTTAVAVAEKRTVHSSTLSALLLLRANILERMGSPYALMESRSQYERAWTCLPGKGAESSRVASKLGDISYRLGDNQNALVWWLRSIRLTRDTDSEIKSTSGILVEVPKSSPSSPLLQRTLIATLISLSAFYSTSGQLDQAQILQKDSLDLLRSIQPPDSLPSTSPPHALHALYLLHRSAILSIHHAEVLFALSEPAEQPIRWLVDAAQSSERVARALVEAVPSPDATPKLPTSSSTSSLLPVYSKSRSMSKAATSLLRNARRSAAESWNLLGVLSEKVDGSRPEKALECYERALQWVGVEPDQKDGNWKPRDGVLELEWRALWSNYIRAKDVVTKQVVTVNQRQPKTGYH